VSAGKIGLMIANRGLPEVEVMKRSDGNVEIALTLLRGINWISRDDFEGRQGHAGPMTSTPGAQMIGRWMFDYSIIPYAAGQDSIPLYDQAYAFDAPMRTVSTGLHAGQYPASGSFVSVEPREFIISAIKPAEASAEGRGDGHGWLVRGYNLTSEKIQVTLKPWKPFEKVERVNLAEEKLATLKPEKDGRVTVNARGHEIVSVMFLD
jgi:alpha-mannosidase